MQLRRFRRRVPSRGFRDSLASIPARLRADRLLLAAVAFVAVAAIALPGKFFPLAGLYIAYVPASASLVVAMLAGDALYRTPSRPLAEMRARLAMLPPRLFVSVFLIFLVLAAFTAFKVSIPEAVPFYADPYLVEVDRWLHGQDPWKIVRVLPGWMAQLVDFTYSQLWFAVALGIFLRAAVFDSRPEFRRLAVMSFVILAGLGVGLATMLSSVGPVFYDRYYAEPQFPLLVRNIYENHHAATQIVLMEYLHAAASSDVFLVGTGISAMPSIHVAVAVSVAWYLTGKGPLRALAGWAFAAVIMFGSVYTGWHYAVDGYVSLVLVTALWFGLSAYYRLPSTFLAAGRGGAVAQAVRLEAPS